jgi:hypothetical protein
MLLVYLAWLSVLAMFAAALYALHTVAIYTHGPLQRSLQQVHLRRLRITRNVLCACACVLLSLHFTLVVPRIPHDALPPAPHNASAQS